MHRPRFAHPHYISYQNQLGPHGFRFGPMWPPIQYQNRQANVYIKETSNSQNINGDHWCETCDRGFRTSQLLENHKQQHQKCNIDGCQFIAHPKVITKHIQMQHSTGLYKKIAKLNSPEEIQKWREERKKRYPTKENIEKKGAEIKEKIDRGEKMGMRCYSRKRPNRTENMKNKYSHDMTRQNRHNFKRRHQASNCSIEVKKQKQFDINKKHPIPKRGNDRIAYVNDTKTLKAFAGILNLMDDTDSDNVKEDLEISDPIENDEYIMMNDYNVKHSPLTEPVVCGALTSLINNYESSDGDMDNDTTEMKDKKPDIILNNKKDNDETTRPHGNLIKKDGASINMEKSDDDSGPEEVKIVKAVETDNKNDVISKKEKSNCQFSKSADVNNRPMNTKIKKENIKNFKPKLPSTLLEKLLHTEIRHERNIILQCIRHIVRNNYFEKS